MNKDERHENNEPKKVKCDRCRKEFIAEFGFLVDHGFRVICDECCTKEDKDNTYGEDQ